MKRFLLIVAVSATALSLAKSNDEIKNRPLTNSDSILAILQESMGRGSDGIPRLSLAIWSDGQIVWSCDIREGKPPYRCGQIEKQKVAALLSRFEQDGLFGADANLSRGRLGPTAPYTTLLVRKGHKQLKMQSWHEVFEESGGLIAADAGVTSLKDTDWISEMKRQPIDYLYFRLIWNEVRGRMLELIPFESKPINGKIVVKDDAWHWQEN